MARSWHDFGDISEPIRVDTMARAAGLVQLDELDEHGLKVAAVDGFYYLFLEDGTVAGPLEYPTFAGQKKADIAALYRANILTQEHLESIETEERQVRERKAAERRESDRESFVSRVLHNRTQPLREKLEELRKRVSDNLGALTVTELKKLNTECRELDDEVIRLNDLNVNELLTPDQLTEYEAI